MPANAKKVKATNSYRLPERLPKGETLTGVLGDKYEIGDVAGSGGFGVIYLARALNGNASHTDDSKTKSNGRTAKSKSAFKYEYVIKVDHADGPLFAEMHFYSRVAKKILIGNWLKEKGLKSIGIPEYISSGMYNYTGIKSTKNKKGEDSKYRFLVMPRFGLDLQKVLDLKSRLSVKTAYTIGIKVLEVLEYVHSNGYIHADIKASNLLLNADITDPLNTEHEHIWLVDYGLADRFMANDKHREYCEDKRKENNGTVEFLARDSHVGAFSRKNDMEILAYNILSWTSGGRLPWMSNLEDYNYVRESKKTYMSCLHELFNYAFKSPSPSCDGSPKENKNGPNTGRSNKKAFTASTFDSRKMSDNVPDGLVQFFQAVIDLDFTEKPDYEYFQQILRDGIKAAGQVYTGKFDFNSDVNTSRRSSRSTVKRTADQLDEVHIETIPKLTINEENGQVRSRLRRNLVQKNEPEPSNSMNSNQLQVLESIRSKRTNGLSGSVAPVLRPKRKNTENHIDSTNVKSASLEIETEKEGRAVRKSTRNLRSNSKLKQTNGCKESDSIIKKSNDVSTDSSNEISKAKGNPTPAMLEIMRKLNEKKKT